MVVLGLGREAAAALGPGLAITAELRYTATSAEPRAVAAGPVQPPDAAAVAAAFCAEAVSAMAAAIVDGRAGRADDARPRLAALAAAIEGAAASAEELGPRLEALLKDVAGRAQKSLEGQDRFERWGMHYLRSLLRAHQLRTCTNFMDPGLQVRTATAITRISECASL